MGIRTTTILIALAVAFGMYLGCTFKKQPPPCPAYDARLVDSLRYANAVLRADSALQHKITLDMKAAIEQTKTSHPPVQKQVQDAYRFTRLLLPDSIARGLLADPPGVTE